MAVHVIVFTLLWIISCGYAAWHGGAPERITAATFVAAIFLSPIAEGPHDPNVAYHSFSIGIFLVDIVVLAVLLTLMLLSSRFWPMLMSAMQGASVLAHVARALGDGIVPTAYAATVVFWSFPMLGLLGWVTLRHQRRLGTFGVDPAWVSDLPASYLAGGTADVSTANQ